MNYLINTVLPASLAISLISQLVFFFFATAFKTDIVTDLAYSLGFISVIAFLYSKNPYIGFEQTMIIIMVLFWAIRLGGYLFLRILKIKKDKRFDNIREKFWSFAKFWLLQAVSIWIILLPTIIFLSKTPPASSETLNFWQIVGIIIWSLGLTIETIADAQKFSFKNNPQNEGLWIQSGLWKYSRHPNYFGEMMVWWGIFIFTLTSLSGLEHLVIIGPIFITLLLRFATGIPPLEKKYQKRYRKNEKYQKYVETTRLLLPLPKKNNP